MLVQRRWQISAQHLVQPVELLRLSQQISQTALAGPSQAFPDSGQLAGGDWRRRLRRGGGGVRWR